jgi:hypothetical protein
MNDGTMERSATQSQRAYMFHHMLRHTVRYGTGATTAAGEVAGWGSTELTD